MNNSYKNLSQTFKDHAINAFVGLTTGTIMASLLPYATEDNYWIAAPIALSMGAASAFTGKYLSKDYKQWTNFGSLYLGMMFGLAVGLNTGAIDVANNQDTPNFISSQPTLSIG